MPGGGQGGFAEPDPLEGIAEKSFVLLLKKKLRWSIGTGPGGPCERSQLTGEGLPLW